MTTDERQICLEIHRCCNTGMIPNWTANKPMDVHAMVDAVAVAAVAAAAAAADEAAGRACSATEC